MSHFIGLRRVRALAAEQHPLNTNKKLFRLFEALCESFTNDPESCWHSDRPSLLLGTIQEVAVKNLSKGKCVDAFTKVGVC